MSVNKAILIGRIGKDPETTTSGKTSFSLATGEKWKDKEGNVQERTDWHNCIAWGKTGENIAKFFKKGSPIYVEGRIQYSSWEDKDGNKKYMTEINISNFDFIGSKGTETATEEKPAETTTEQPVTGETENKMPF